MIQNLPYAVARLQVKHSKLNAAILIAYVSLLEKEVDKLITDEDKLAETSNGENSSEIVNSEPSISGFSSLVDESVGFELLPNVYERIGEGSYRTSATSTDDYRTEHQSNWDKFYTADGMRRGML